MKKLTIGVLAHVDAGKTTLCEALLYISNSIKHLGRVDNHDSFLDTYFEERRRGITIFSKIAQLNYKDCHITIIDTPGHSDFSAEMERSLLILDYAILIISGTDGIQSHTYTLLNLLKKYDIPTFIFITKMDVAKRSRQDILDEINLKSGIACINFTDNIDYESVAMLEDNFIEEYLENGKLSNNSISKLIKENKFYPCYYGSGLKLNGVKELLDGLNEYTIEPKFDDNFSASVFKINHDERGKRLTLIKLTGGSLAVKSIFDQEKVNEIRIYSGSKYEVVSRVSAGDVCALIGLNKTKAGTDLQTSNITHVPVIDSVLNYSVLLPNNVNVLDVLPKFKELEEEDPTLHISWDKLNKTIGVNLMGKVQTEVLTAIMKDRYNIDISFGSGKIIYKETIANTVEGVGHYEPLKHYAEVHLLLEPLPRGSGIIIENNVSTDDLDINYQNLILTHIMEKQHVGVMTGSQITDIKITLIAGRAHLKHTEGGDFRQATYRAIRHGLMNAKSILLEPIYQFNIEVPNECVGRAISDLHNMEAKIESQNTLNYFTVLSGYSPVRTISDYYNQVISYTSGRGKVSLNPIGYDICSCQQKIIDEISYDPLNDEENTPNSIFCAHGAGTNIMWDQVYSYCHLPLIKDKSLYSGCVPIIHHRINLDDDELEQIMEREFGPIKRKKYTKSETVIENSKEYKPIPTTIIIDGYNVIFSWEEFKILANENIDLAREKFIRQIVNYQAFTGLEVILVFDAYSIPGGKGSKTNESKFHLVYTHEGETADAYIEKFISEVGKNTRIKVVSNDNLIQVSAVKTGVLRVSAKEFKYDVDEALSAMRKLID